MIELWVYFVRLLNSSRWFSHDSSGLRFRGAPDQVIMLRAASEIKLDSVCAKYNLLASSVPLDWHSPSDAVERDTQSSP